MAYFLEGTPGAHPANLMRELFGFIPRVFLAQGGIPDIVEAEAVLLHALLAGEDALTRVQKEWMLLAASAANRVPYGTALHGQMLKLLGVSDAEIANVVEGREPAEPDAPLVQLARRLMLEPASTSRDEIDRLRRLGFTPGQIVEAIVTAGFCRFLNTVQLGAGAAPDFAARPIPVNIPHPEAALARLPIEDPAAAPQIIDDPDGECVQRVQQGDTEAFAILVERHNRRVYRMLAGLLGNGDEAKDAMQDTFLKAFQSLAHFERKAKFSTWLMTIAANTGTQRLRERKPLDSLDDDGGGGDTEDFRPRQIRAWTDDPEQSFSKEERRALVERSIMALPAKYRVVLTMRDIQQMSTDDTAAALGLGVPALKARLLRGRLMLREALTPYFLAGVESA